VTKYRAIPTEVEGIRFASRMEARRFQELRMLERAGEISNLKLQTRWPLVVNGVKVCEYRPDFEYDEGGRHVVEDVKGKATPEFRLKAKLMKAIHGVTVLETTA
jgi:hypothetical protein